MTDTKTEDEATTEASDPPEPASEPPAPKPAPTTGDRPRSLARLRQMFIFGAIGLSVLALVLTATGGGASTGLVGTALWGAVAVCFFAAFVVYRMESTPQKALEAAAREAAAPVSIPEAPESTPDAKGPLLQRGNPLRRARGGIVAGAGGFLALLLMANKGQLRFGVPLGAVFVAVAAFGVMDLVGSFDDPEDRVEHKTTLGSLFPSVLRLVVSGLLFCATVALAASGKFLSQWVWGLLVTGTFALLVSSIFELGVQLGPWAKDETGEARPLLQRHGFWVVIAAALLYFPFMGSFSLWDPWETHYGEVAREILSRDDWISLWWAQDGWFWSKPILNFWIQAIAMASLGVHYKPDQMLVGNGHDPIFHPEWAVRLPVVLLTILAMYLLYKGVAKAFGRRAGLLGGLVLATMPDWFFLAHQTMTDMPFVAPMTAAMGLLLLGLSVDAEQKARLYEVKAGKLVLRFSGWHLVFGAILICALPQVLYLLSRNIEFVPWAGFRPHLDEFKSGSAGNCGLPGNEGCNPALPASIPKSFTPGSATNLTRVFGAFEPVVQGLAWLAAIIGLLYVNWGERRVRRLYYLAAWLFAAIAIMGKGIAGVLPLICAFAYVCATKKWKEITRLEVGSGLLIIAVVALPWYIAMYVRHGMPFIDRLIFHDMWSRAFKHVHDTNEGDDTSFRYYIWQLGYALFPWTGLAPLGLTYWLRRGDAADERKGDTSIMLVMWFVFAFALFSYMGTKFHHYIFPAVPPCAMLIGVALDEMIGDKNPAGKGSVFVYVGGMLAGVALMVLGVSRFWPGSVFGAKLDGAKLAPANFFLGGVLVAVGAAVAVAFALLFRDRTASEPLDDAAQRRRQHESLMFAGAAAGAALVLVLVGRDLVIKPENHDQPGAIRLLQLFTYNYRRPWPESLDFSAALAGFAVVAVGLSIAMTVQKIRRHAVVAFAALAFVWAAWGTDVYMVKTAPHWGQHEVIEAYYKNRRNADEQLVAYQMNWKGENFYTGNRIPAFVSTGATFSTWLKQQRDKGQKVMFFVTEHSRVGGLKSEVGAKSYAELTTKELCNKFVLVRAEL